MENIKQIQILLYGNSILLESLAFKLKQVEGWDVKRSEGGDVKEMSRINFIVTDLCDITASEALPMLTALTGVTLIGVDSIANTITVLTGRSHPSDVTRDVIDTLKKAM